MTVIARRAFMTWAMIVASFLLLTASSAGAAEPAPAWSLSVSTYPTIFPKGVESSFEHVGPGYLLVATNVGGTATDGTAVKISDEVPVGIEPSELVLPEAYSPRAGFGFNCAVEGQTVSCESSEEVVPGETIYVRVPVDVPAGAPDQLSNVAEVSGGGAAAPRTVTTVTHLGPEVPSFDFLDGPAGLSTNVTEPDGSTTVTAGAHPYQASVTLGFPSEILGGFELHNISEPKDIKVTLPRGFYVNPTATARCRMTQFLANKCPLESQVGIATSIISLLGPNAQTEPVWNLVPPLGSPAQFGFEAGSKLKVLLSGHVNAAGEYELAATSSDTLAKVAILGAQISLWGDPSDASHDAARGIGSEGGCLGVPPQFAPDCSVERRKAAFLTLPGDCPGSPGLTAAEADGWLEPGRFVSRTVPSTDLDGNPVSVSGCGALSFSPTISSQPTEGYAPNQRADSPTGLDFVLHQPQNLSSEGLGTANLKDAEVTLPEGVSVNPSGANGLGACTESEIGRLPDQDGKLRFSEVPQTCPNAAKIGTMEVSTPLVEHKLAGEIYVAKPFQHPFNSLLAIYLAIEDEESGVIAKLAGKVTPDPVTGQLTAKFTENPELPLEDISLHFFDGPTAALKTPLTCGTYTTTSALVPWSTPEGATAHPTDAFGIDTAASGSGNCPTSEAGAPASPSFAAGTVTPTAGSYSPFVLNLARADGEQHITGIDTTLPAGLLGRLAGIPYCSEAQIAAAKAREVPERGALEATDPSCPAASEVGTVTIGAGAGSSPYYASGKAYLAGPYKGAALSLVIVAPAVAGPFDLGDVVTRVALEVEPYSAQIHAVSDPLPTIIAGIPLDLRSISLRLDRPDFVLNPTSCKEAQVTGRASTQAGASAALAERFQVGGCSALGFKPAVKLSVKGATGRTGHPALKAVVTYPKQGAYSNISRAQVGLPGAEFLDQGNLNKVCTQADLRAATCPKSAIYGRAKAWSPLLDKPLEGPVYLGVGFGYKLPALVADLNGQVRILLKGKVDTTKHRGLRTTFEAVPDAPVSRFVLEMKGGRKYGLLENSEDICEKSQSAGARFLAQNGTVDKFMIPIANSCGHRHKPHGK